MEKFLQHHGILGMHWGKTNGPPYPLDDRRRSAEERRLAKKDTKWIKRKEEKIKSRVIKKSEKDIKQMTKTLDSERSRYNSNGQISSNYINEYNRRLADIMNTKVGDIESPSGKVVRFVAKRGEIGVYTALADKAYDMDKVRNGVWSSGRVGYKKEELDTI